MKVTILTIFPDFFEPYLSWGILSRALDNKELEVSIRDIREYATNKHKKVDDYPFGGGAGMLMSPQPLYDALLECSGRKIHLSPRGRVLDDQYAEQLSKEVELTLVCSHYEGMDQRIIDYFSLEEVSIGDYVLSGGELSALILMDSVLRKCQGFISDKSLEEESFTHGLLEYDQYTRPRVFHGLEVPEILLSGHHENIRKYQLENAVQKTLFRRPDLIEKGLKEGRFTQEVKTIIEKLRKEDRNE